MTSMECKTSLICALCEMKLSPGSSGRSCPRCGGPLLVDRDLSVLVGRVTRNTFMNKELGVWRYAALLPFVEERNIVSLGEGGTALLECDRLARALGLRRLLLKDETTNPTGSFLDRGMTLDVSRAKDLGFRSLECRFASGNFAASAAAYASRAGFACTIRLQRENAERTDLGKLYQMIAYGADLIVDDEANSEREDCSVQESYVLSPGNPHFAEGEKTTAFEICEQLGWRIPDRIIAPMGHGEYLSMIWRGIRQLEDLSLINRRDVIMTGVQVGDYAGIVDQLHGDKSKSTDRGKTIATDLAMKDPTHRHLAIRTMMESGGQGVKVSDDEVLDAMSLLARTEGVFAEPAAASTIAGLRKLVGQGHIDSREEVLCVITGAGLKDPATARKFTKKVRAIDGIVSQMESRRFTTRFGKTKFQILNIVLKKESYGYEIWKMLSQEYHSRMDISSVYQHLSELERTGLIKRTKVRSVLGKPERYYYSLTGKGRSVARAAKAEVWREATGESNSS